MHIQSGDFACARELYAVKTNQLRQVVNRRNKIWVSFLQCAREGDIMMSVHTPNTEFNEDNRDIWSAAIVFHILKGTANRT